jgi:hypothetical protein
MKYIITESQYNKAIDKFITYHLEPHEEKTSKKYPDSIFWTNISIMFSLEYKETQEVIKYWLEEHYNLGSLTPADRDSVCFNELEEH